MPRSLRDGSLGLGATRSETIKRVILPAALPGIVGALLLTASRAVGETMIVVLAAGVAARMQLNPFEPMTTVTVKIVNQLTGDLEFNSPQTLVAFALGITLFCHHALPQHLCTLYRAQIPGTVRMTEIASSVPPAYRAPGASQTRYRHQAPLRRRAPLPAYGIAAILIGLFFLFVLLVDGRLERLHGLPADDDHPADRVLPKRSSTRRTSVRPTRRS